MLKSCVGMYRLSPLFTGASILPVFPLHLLRSWLIVACLLLAGGPALAAAGALDLSSRLAILEDPGGRASLDEVIELDRSVGFQPYRGSGVPNFGYSHSAWWLRIDLPELPAESRRWLLEVAFPTLDDVRLYRLAPGGRREYRSGDQLPFAERPLVHRHFVFPLELSPDGGTRLYLRVESQGTLTIPLRLWQADDFARADQTGYAAHALYYGMLIGLGLYNLLIWARLRENVYLAYVAFVAAMAVGQLALSGFGYQFVWPEWRGWQAISLSSGFAATGLFGAWFTRLFLDTARRQPQLDRWLRLSVAAFALVALMPLVLPYQWAAQATSVIGLLFSVLAVFCGVSSLRQGNPAARFFLIAWLVLLFGVALMALRNLALVPTNFVTANGIQFGSALEMLLLSFALAERISLLRLEKESATARALESERARVQLLEESERLLESRVDERTRELAETNRRLQTSQQRLHDMAHHDALTGLANRTLLFDRVEQAILRAQRSDGGFALVVIDLDGFKAVNDTYGHQAGDALLVVLADRLEHSVRASDTVARLGGDEFVVVLEGRAERDQYRKLAEKLRQVLVEPVMLDDDTSTRVGASIGLSLYPADGASASQLLSVADFAMYANKRSAEER